MRHTPVMLAIWAMVALFALLWIIGLAVSWGGWVWVFFVIALAGLAVNYLAISARRP